MGSEKSHGLHKTLEHTMKYNVENPETTEKNQALLAHEEQGQKQKLEEQRKKQRQRPISFF